MFWAFLLIALASILIYYNVIKIYSYWITKGIKQEPARSSAYKTWKFLIRQNKPVANTVSDLYNKYSDSRYFGIYLMVLPVLVIKDLDLIKQVAVKDFDHFLDRRQFVDTENDELWSNNLFALTGKKWKEMRSTLSPAFTSNKMKYMFKLIEENAKQFTEHFLGKDESFMTVEMKDIYTRFANDVIATTAFGIECDSLMKPENEFYLMGKQITNFATLTRNLKILGYFAVPKLYKLFKISLFTKDEVDFFSRIVNEAIETREKHQIIRPDMLNILLQAKSNKNENEAETDNKSQKSRKFQITDLNITSQALSFFLAGFDTVSSLLCFASYELAINPEIQKRLHDEIAETHKVCGENELTYEALTQLKYLDMVISESLRKWPFTVATDRVCTKPYQIPPALPGETLVTLKRNDSIWIPIFALHRDPNYYPDPDRFDPERFSDGNRHKINPYAYLPFGVGPRGCIGSRLAILEVKIILYYVLLHFEFVPVERTPIPIKISNKQFSIASEGDLWLGLRRRQTINKTC